MSALFPSSHVDMGLPGKLRLREAQRVEWATPGPRNGASWVSWESPIQFQGSPGLGCVQAENSLKQFPPKLVREIRATVQGVGSRPSGCLGSPFLPTAQGVARFRASDLSSQDLCLPQGYSLPNDV